LEDPDFAPVDLVDAAIPFAVICSYFKIKKYVANFIPYDHNGSCPQDSFCLANG
jgi:hypothetical protein